MHRYILASFAITCLLFMLFLTGYQISVKANPEVWTVDDDGSADFHTIQEAINTISLGETIFVHRGTYYENVIVDKSVSLIGEDRNSTIIDGNGIGSVISIVIGANNVSISGFTIQHSGNDYRDSGVYVDHSSRNDISHNTIANNRNGINLIASSNNMVFGNTISSNKNDGIGLQSSGNNVIFGNTISSNNNDGISLFSSHNNVIFGNTISSNNNDGIILWDSSNNKFYHNNFIDNTLQVYIPPLTGYANSWDAGFPNGGNYWSDYEYRYSDAKEMDETGIWNTPYIINLNNKDNNPLVGTFADFTVAMKRETYHVSMICNSTISGFRFEIGLETGNKIMRFNVTGKDDTIGFCRIMIPTELMNYHYVILVDDEEILPILLEDISNETYVHLYFTYKHSSHTITIISSLVRKLEIDLHNLNATYHALLNKYSELQQSYYELNNSYQEHLNNYSVLLGNYSELQQSYEEYLLDYSKNAHNVRNLMYIFATTTAIFLVITIYLSKRAHGIPSFCGKTLDRPES